MLVSVLIVTYQSEQYITQCLQSLRDVQLGEKVDLQIIVVDNASTDMTCTLIQNDFADVQLVRNPQNVGFAEAVNQAANEAQGKFLLLLNPDTQVSRNSLLQMLLLLEKHPEVAATGPISNYAGGLQSAKHWVQDPEQSLESDAREQVAERLLSKFKGHSCKTKLLVGFCLLIRRTAWDQVEGLDSALVLGLDDLDLCWRLSLYGFDLRVCLSAFVFHAWHKSFTEAPNDAVERMEKCSHEHFSQKLIAYYQGFEKIPSSRDLWGVDWFTPLNLSEPQVSSPMKSPSIAPKNQQVLPIRFGAVWVSKETPGGATAVKQTLDAWRHQAGHMDQILILDQMGLDAKSIPAEVDHWHLAAGLDWSKVLQKLQRWFGQQGSLVLMEAGMILPIQSWETFDILEPMTGPVQGRQKGNQIDISLTQVFNMHSLGYAVIPLQKDWSMQSSLNFAWCESCQGRVMDWELPLESAVQKAVESDRQQQSMDTGNDLFEQLKPYIEGFKRIGVTHGGLTLDLNNQPIDLEQCDLVIWKLHPLEIDGWSRYLTGLRQSGVRRLITLFDNAFYAGSDVASGGVLSPLDVRREILQGGFSISRSEPWLLMPQWEYSSKQDSVQVQADGFLKEEKLWSTASRIMMVADACSSQQHPEKVVSIVLLALNQLEYTRKCIESIQKNCHQTYELILVNNGSTDETSAYFHSIPGAKVVDNHENLGVAKGWNQGLALAQGDFILILNNDTIVAPHCIENLVRCAINHPEAGIVAPRSNRIAGPQQVEAFLYEKEDDIPLRAEEIQQHHDLSCWEFSRIKGFCMLIPREVVDAVGMFDENFGYGNFEDDDYSCRVRFSGWKLLVSDDSFLFHYGSVSFQNSGIDWNAQMVRNKQLFEQKWSRGRLAVVTRQKGPLAHSSLIPAEERQSAESILSAWRLFEAGQVEEAQKLFQVWIDQKPEDASVHFGLGMCLVQQGKPRDAFTLFCRSLELDPVEEVAQETVALLNSWYEAENAGPVLSFFRKKYPQLSAFQQKTNDSADVTWKNQVKSYLESQQWNEAFTLLIDRKERCGEDFDVCNLLGVLKYYQGVFDESSRWFQKALHYDPTHRDVLLNLHDAHLRLGTPALVKPWLEQALSLKPDLYDVRMALDEIRQYNRGEQDAQRVILFRESNVVAENYIREGLHDKAAQLINRILTEEPDNYRALNNQGLLDWYQQRLEKAWDCFFQAVSLNLWYVDAYMNLVDTSYLLDRLDQIKDITRRVLDANPDVHELQKVSQDMQNGGIPDRLKTYFQKQREDDDFTHQVEHAHRLLETQKIDSAVLIFSDLLKDYPEHPDLLAGIGIAAFYRGDYEDAWVLFHHALQQRPLDEDSLLNFWDASLKTGRRFEAEAVLQNALAVNPSLARIAGVLEDKDYGSHHG